MRSVRHVWKQARVPLLQGQEELQGPTQVPLNFTFISMCLSVGGLEMGVMYPLRFFMGIKFNYKTILSI